MKKMYLTIFSAFALSLAVTGTAMAKSHDKPEKEAKHEKFEKLEKKSERKTGLENALDHVKNPKAREAIKRALERQKLEGEAKTDQQAVAADKAALKVGFAEGDSAVSVTQAVDLPATGKYGSTITWTSSNPAVISNDGKTVVRSADADVKVILTATIKKNAVTATKTFELTVKAKLTDAQIVAADKTALAIGFSGSDTASFVTSPLTLPTKGLNGSTIAWVSGNPAVISNDGKTVVRPAIDQGDATVTLVATISSNGMSDVKTFTLIVKQQLSDADKVAADKAALTIGFSQGDSLTSITSKLTLPTTGVNGSAITWVSSAPAIVSNDGNTVNRPAAGQGDASVTLTATITSNGVTDVKTFAIVVKQQLTDAQKVAADKAALAIGYSGADTAASVTSKLTLPTTGPNGSITVWYSSNTVVVSDNGTVVRPAAGTGDKTVTLTAIIVNNSAFDTKSLTVTVKQLP